MRQRFPVREMTTSVVTGVRLALLEGVNRAELGAYRMTLRASGGIVGICHGHESSPVKLPETRQAHQGEVNTGDRRSFVLVRDISHPVICCIELDLQVVAACL